MITYKDFSGNNVTVVTENVQLNAQNSFAVGTKIYVPNAPRWLNNDGTNREYFFRVLAVNVTYPDTPQVVEIYKKSFCRRDAESKKLAYSDNKIAQYVRDLSNIGLNKLCSGKVIEVSDKKSVKARKYDRAAKQFTDELEEATAYNWTLSDADTFDNAKAEKLITEYIERKYTKIDESAENNE